MIFPKVWLVLRREYAYNFRRPSFLFTAFGVPLISLVAMFLIFQFATERETNLDKFQRVGYVDRAMILDPAGPNPAEYTPVTYPDLPMPAAESQPDALPAHFDALEERASAQLLAGELDAYFVIPEHYVLSGQVTLVTQRSVPQALLSDIEDFLAAQIAHRAPETLPVPVERLADVEFTLRDLDSGEELSEAALVGRLLLPFIFVLIYFMATSTTAQFLMSGVVEEKENRLMEILATSLRPGELLVGKLLGLGALALTQVVLWGAGGLLIAQINEDARAFLGGVKFETSHLILIGALFVINFLIFSASMLGIGAAVTAEAESRQIAGFFTILTVLPIMFSVAFFTNPDGPLPLFFSFFPLTAAVGLTMRLSVGTLPDWQIWLSMAIQIVTALIIVWLAVKVFRLGMLMYGKPLTPRTLWAALREGRVTLTSAPVEAGEVVRAPRRRRGLFR
ncbi:MAG: ABC transporter permease [Anaerolineae bacterium]|nr:ABC transporter permease [Anaerolineae bacterium]